MFQDEFIYTSKAAHQLCLLQRQIAELQNE